MQTRLPLFLKWGIWFGDPYEVAEQAARPVSYADRFELEQEIMRRRDECDEDGDFGEPLLPTFGKTGSVGQLHAPTPEHKAHRGQPPRPPLRTD